MKQLWYVGVVPGTLAVIVALEPGPLVWSVGLMQLAWYPGAPLVWLS